MIALKQRTYLLKGLLYFLGGFSPKFAVQFGLLLSFSLSTFSMGQSKEPKLEALGLDDFAEIYVDRYFEPTDDLKLTDDSRHKAEALAHYSIGRMLEKDGDQSAAIKSYEKVLELQPGEIMLARKTANLLARTGRTDTSLELLERALKLNPNKARAYVVLSEFLYTYFSDNEDDRERSLKLANEAVEKFPDEPEVYENLVRRHLIEGQPTEARKLMDRATARENSDPRFWLRLGELAKRTWPTRSSGTKVPVLVNDFYEKALKRAGKDVRVAEAVGDYYRKSNQQKRAQEIFEDIIDKNPDRLDVRRKLVAVFVAQGNEEKAIDALKGIVEIDPQDADTNRELGRIYFARMSKTAQAAGLREPDPEDPDLLESAQYFRRALRAGKGTAGEYIQTGKLYAWAEKIDQAIDVLEEGAYLFPESPQFPLEIAEIYMDAERWKDAVEPMNRTIKLATQSQPELLSEIFYYRFGVVYERVGDIEKCAVQFRKAIELIGKRDPNDPPSDGFVALVYNYLGYTWVENDMNIDEGGELIKTALELDPTSGAITDSLGWYYFKKEKFEEARKTLLKAQEMMELEREQVIAEGGQVSDPDGVIFDHIAQAHWMAGYKKEAVEFMEKAVVLEKDRKEEFVKRLKEYQEGEPPVERPAEEKPAKKAVDPPTKPDSENPDSGKKADKAA